jgi:hypothetical protein
MKIRQWLLLSAVGLWSCASVSSDRVPDPIAGLAAITSNHLERFRSEAEFYDYLHQLREVARSQHLWWASDYKPTGSTLTTDSLINELPQAMPAPPPPPPPPAAPAATQAGSEQIVVTGSRITQQDFEAISPVTTVGAENITNVQTRGVDEGDIVKQVGHFLIVLQDGRLFTVDLHPRRGGLAFVDRVNVYRNPHTESWYDEMLVYRNRVVVTGYSYVRGASEITVFSLSEDGHLTREAVYYMSSSDYYDPENYATRLVDDNLVIYSPLSLARRLPNNRVSWPLIRRWIRGDGEHMELSKGHALFDARDIYRPVQPTLDPVIHSISVCPLGSPRHGDELDCRATAFIGPSDRQFYIAPDAAYLWINGDQDENRAAVRCDDSARQFENGAPGALFRAPFGGGAPSVLGVRGQPRNQFGLASTDAEFRALLFWADARCGRTERLTLKYFSAPLSAFGNTFVNAAAERFVDVPPVDDGMYENRFTDRYVVYGSRGDYSSAPPADSDALPPHARVVAVPLANPSAAVTLDAPHNIIRAERIGPSNILLTGYANWQGLSLSVLDLTGAPRFTTTETLAGRFESEGRSHAFNAHVGDDNAGLLGLPTVHGVKQSGRWVWNTNASDVSYLSLDTAGLHALGELRANPHSVDRSYHCEVSCVDWYGNSRPIFTDGRIFALSATELIEGRLERGHIVEVRRVNLTRPPPR